MGLCLMVKLLGPIRVVVTGKDRVQLQTSRSIRLVDRPLGRICVYSSRKTTGRKDRTNREWRSEVVNNLS